MISCKTKVFELSASAFSSGQRLIVNKGGTRSGKTFSIVLLLLILANKQAVSIDVVSESFPHLKRGVQKDVETILDEWGFVEGGQYKHNRSSHEYTFASGGVLRMFSVDDWGKVKGSNREILFVNEANRISFEAFRQLAVRTTRTIFIDFNPDSEFWYEEQNLNTEPTTTEINSTYKDNPFLSEAQIAEIERNKKDEAWWRVYGLGLTGSRKGLCLTNWQQCTAMPETNKRWLGLDFGFANDPTAIVDVRLNDGQLWVDELLYRTGMTNFDIYDFLESRDLQLLPIVADSAELKSVEELRRLGCRWIEAAQKGGGSVQTGIDILNRYQMNVTSSSLNIIKELRNYRYNQTKEGVSTNTPIDAFNHSIDAIRYVALNKIYTPKGTGVQKVSLKKMW